MKISIESKGVKKAIAKVRQWELAKIREIKRIIAETAYAIQAEAQSLAPVNTGNLRESITVNISNDGLTAIVKVGAEYAIYVEYGTGIYAKDGNGRKTPWVYYSEELHRYVYTHGIRAQPFFYPAVKPNEKRFIERMNRLA